MQCIHYLTAAGFIFLDKIPCNHKLSDNKYSWMITFAHFYTFLLLCSCRFHSFYKFVETASLEPPRPYRGIPAPEPTVTLIKLGLGFFYWILKLETCCQMIQHTQRHHSNWESIINTSFTHNYPGYRVHYGAKTVSSVTHREKLISFLRTCL